MSFYHFSSILTYLSIPTSNTLGSSILLLSSFQILAGQPDPYTFCNYTFFCIYFILRHLKSNSSYLTRILSKHMSSCYYYICLLGLMPILVFPTLIHWESLHFFDVIELPFLYRYLRSILAGACPDYPDVPVIPVIHCLKYRLLIGIVKFANGYYTQYEKRLNPLGSSGFHPINYSHLCAHGHAYINPYNTQDFCI